MNYRTTTIDHKGLVALLVLIISLCSSSKLIGHSAAIIQIDSIPAEGILLDKGWKYHIGDNPEWAKPDYDDSQWQSVDPAQDIYELPMLWKDSVVWFRIKLYLGENLLPEHLVLLTQQSGASEIYLNGELIKSFGEFSSDPTKAKAYDPSGKPISLHINQSGLQIISIRYILQQGINYKTIFGAHNYGINLKVNTLESFLKNDQKFTYFLLGPGFLVTGIFFILTILHFSLFWFNRSQKANFFFFIFTFLTMIGFFLNVLSLVTNLVEDKFGIFFPAACIIIVGNLFMVTSIYFQLEQRRDIWFWVLVSLYFFVLFSIILPGYWGWEIVAQSSQILVNIEIGRITFLAFRRRQQGAKILAMGSIFCFLGWTAFTLFGIPGEVDLFSLLVFNIAFLSIPIAASVNLGVESGITSKLLKDKLGEVERLSKKTIEQEKEKQLLLASQNETLERQVLDRTHELQESLQNLKSTQAQLIQSEKLASLGELTAGIAHEIQNPLNFVNNFSEVNTELIKEIQDERRKTQDKRDEKLEDELLHDIVQNQEKINHHGKRAADIVKGMLQHSRTSSGTREPTDINALADEYLRLAYHGLRAKDKSFNADFKADLDPSLPKASVIPQDIGRVLLNLINNAFYAVSEKSKKGIMVYEPTVMVKTKKKDKMVEIRVKDNGDGIPDDIVNKIFQPFFTTKPTGQGTGLGLSLSYDIVTKGHNGTLEVDTTAGVGSEFIIQLPVV